MRVLVVGGSGHVGTLVRPALAERFELCIFDRKPPDPGPWEYVQGDVTDPEALMLAAQGADALLYMAMGAVPAGSGITVQEPITAFDVNVKGLYLALEAGCRTGIRRAVYTSSLSVYDGHLDIRSGATDNEDVPAEPRTIYGFTKRMGEEVCHFVHRVHHLPILILRLFLPISQEEWQRRADPNRVSGATSAPDLARALIAALESELPGCEAIHITGDYTGRAYHHEKAKRLLGWEPLERPAGEKSGI